MSASCIALDLAPCVLAVKKKSTEELSEAQIIAQAANGNARAFELLYRRHSARVYALCFRMSRNSEEAEDLTQEVFMQMFRKLGTFRGESSLSTWLHRLTVNAVLMRLRKKRYPEIRIDDAPGEEQDSYPAIVVGVEDLRLKGLFDRTSLEKAVAELPAGYRQIFILHDVQGYEHNEIASLLGCSIGNSKSQLFKARQKLRRILKQHLRLAGKRPSACGSAHRVLCPSS